MAFAYSKEQIERYFDYIDLRLWWRNLKSEDKQGNLGLPLLKVLQRRQLARIPWENIGLHYSSNITPVLGLTDPKEIYDRVLGDFTKENGRRTGRGGVCFENNIFFGGILKGLGYQIYPVGARVNQGKYFATWTHTVNIVTIAGTRYIVDVGFGGRGPVAPLPLLQSQPQDNISPAQAQLVLKPLEEHVNQDQKLWMYQWRSNPDSEWVDKYAMTETEFLPIDFESMAILISFRRGSLFAHSLAMGKMVTAADVGGVGGDEIVGEITVLNNTVRRYIRGKEDVNEVLHSEDERLDALRHWYGIELSTEQRKGIRGTGIDLG